MSPLATPLAAPRTPDFWAPATGSVTMPVTAPRTSCVAEVRPCISPSAACCGPTTPQFTKLQAGAGEESQSYAEG